MKKSFEIYSDCLDIVKRLKEIDKDYFDVAKHRIESESQNQYLF